MIYYLALICGLCFLFMGCHTEKKKAVAKHEPIRPVLTMIATPQSGPADSYTGTIEPRYRTDLGFRVLGRIVTRDVNVGEFVKAGQRLAALDPEVLEIAVRSQKATLSSAIAQRVNSETNLKRQTDLMQRKITSQAAFDAAKQANEAALAEVTRAEEALAKATEQLSYAALTADMNGVVMGVYAETGQTVAAGQSVITIANPDLREAVVDLGEEVAAALTIGDEFRVILQVSANVETTGEVREIAPQADAATRTRRIRIALREPAEAFRMGATISAIPKVVLQDQIRVPASALLEEGGQTFVWVVDQANKQVHRKQVGVFSRDESGAQIEKGIQAGEYVVTAGVHSLKEGKSIRWNAGDMQ